MRIVYLGTPDFAVMPLEKIIASGKNVVGVITNKDKPVGRKRIMTAPPVKLVAEKHGIPVFQYDKIRLEGVQDLIDLAPDIMITCAFGQILSQEILDIPKLGVINIHASLLPKYRGASPIHYAILNGEKQTGITIMKTDIGIDTGDILLKKPIDIFPDETCGQLFERLSVLGADAIIEALDLIENNKAQYVKQDEACASHSKMINKEIAKIDWTDSAEKIFNKIRAFNPAPVAYCFLDGQPFKILKAKVVEISGRPGEILQADKSLVVGCGKNSIALEIVQKSGGKQMAIKDFLLGNKFVVGEEFI